ncbi:MAG: hypothetical protein JNK74_05680 [Candidatus Hydrogenedentes bacterium]|nr:hypothetical protein [Candidatus Hydrogenedentota bacterium]
MCRKDLFLGLIVLFACVAPAVPAETLLFVDDYHVLYRAGTVRVPHYPVRCADNPVIPDAKPWEAAIAWTSVHRDPETGKYQIWYQAYGGTDTPQPQCVTCYAESEDGIHFERPDLGLFNYGDIQQTNIVMVGNGGHSLRYGNAVIVDPRDPDPTRRYKMAYFDFAKDGVVEMPGLHVAFSGDGIHWRKPDVPMPVLPVAYGKLEQKLPFPGEPGRAWSIPLSMSDALDVFYDQPRNCFAIYGKMWIDGPTGKTAWKHAMGRTTSVDFVQWSTPELVLAPDDEDAAHVEFHTSPVFYHAGCYFSLAQILNRAENGGVIDIELLLSRDGLDWKRPFREHFFLPRSDGKGFDSGSIFTNSTPVILEDEIRFYYGAYSMGATSASDGEQLSGVGMASISRDRFAGIRPVSVSDQATLKEPILNTGQITLKPLDFSRYGELSLNADARDGEVRVELLTDRGYRVAGFTEEEAIPMKSDSLRHAVAWRDFTLADLEKGKYLVRIHLKNAEVFALDLLPR